MRRDSYIAKLQKWADEFDKSRSWDMVPPEWVLVHLAEEMGEIARRLLYLGDYKKRSKAVSTLKKELGYELADLIFLACKLANQHNIDLEGFIAGKIAINEKRYPKASGRKEMKRYVQKQFEVWRKTRDKMVK